MEVQSLSICVPAGCPNNCMFCVSKLNQTTNNYPNQIENNPRHHKLYEKDYLQRLMFARDNGCNTVIMTGSGEPITNVSFLRDFAQWNENLESPFRWIELQTSGITIDEERLRFLRNTVHVNTICLSVSNVFDDDSNQRINGTSDKYKVNIKNLCRLIRKYDFNLRLSLNMNAVYHDLPLEDFFFRAQELGANQITFRKLYVSGDPELPQNQWIQANDYQHFPELENYIISYGRELEQLPFGAMRYSINQMSVVLDHDCMATESKEVLKYLILRPNCKLYTKWDDEGSLLF